MKIVSNCYKDLDCPESFFALLAKNCRQFNDVSQFRKVLNNDLLYLELSEHMKNTNTLLKDYVYLIDEAPQVETFTWKDSKLFELMKSLSIIHIRMISIFLSRQAVLIGELSNLLHQQITGFFNNCLTTPFSIESLNPNSDLFKTQKLLKSFTSLSWNFYSNFSNPCLDLPHPESISLRLAVYWNDQNTKASWVLLSRKEKLFIKVDLSEKANLEGEFSEACHEYRTSDGQTLGRKVGIGFNYLRFMNFDSEKLKENFGANAIDEIPPLFQRYEPPSDYSYEFVSYVFQLNVGPLEWPWIIYSELSYEQLREYHVLYEKVSERLQGSKGLPYYSYQCPAFFFFLLRKGFHRPARPRVLEIPTREAKSVKLLNSSRLIIDDVISLEDVNPEYSVAWTTERLEEIIGQNRSYRCWLSKNASRKAEFVSYQ